MDRRFLNAHIDPSRLKLLGRTVYPWCLKYRVRLTAFDSPLVTGSRPPVPEDLILALQICAEEPIGKLGLRDQWRALRLRQDPKRFEQLLTTFSDYVLIQNWPKFWEKEAKKGSNSKGIPWPLSIVSNLIASGIPEQRAWEMPECQAIWLNTALAVSKGADVQVMTPEEEDWMKLTEEAVARSAKVDPTTRPPDDGSIPRSSD